MVGICGCHELGWEVWVVTCRSWVFLGGQCTRIDCTSFAWWIKRFERKIMEGHFPMPSAFLRWEVFCVGTALYICANSPVLRAMTSHYWDLMSSSVRHLLQIRTSCISAGEGRASLFRLLQVRGGLPNIAYASLRVSIIVVPTSLQTAADAQKHYILHPGMFINCVWTLGWLGCCI